MARFLFGLLLGFASGELTYIASADSQLAVICGAIAAVLTWLGVFTLLVADD